MTFSCFVLLVASAASNRCYDDLGGRVSDGLLDSLVAAFLNNEGDKRSDGGENNPRALKELFFCAEKTELM
jgi:hypothetical protein